MSFVHIQGGSTSVGSGTSTTLTLTSNPVTGNLVCVAVLANSENPIPSSMALSDANGNVYTFTPLSPSEANPGGNNNLVWLAYLLSAPANASKTLNFTWVTSSSLKMYADEFSYSGTVSFDKEIAGSGTTGTTVNSPTITPTNTNSLVFAASNSQAAAYTAPTAGGTLGAWTGSDGAIIGGNMAEYDLDVTGAQAVQFTSASSQGWGSMAMAFSVSADVITVQNQYQVVVG